MNDVLLRIFNKVKGLDDFLRGTNTDSSSLKNNVNSHVDAIRILEGKLSLHSVQLKQRITIKEDDKGLAVVTRRGKVVICNVEVNKEG